MALAKVLEQLEERIEELAARYRAARERIAELEARVAELEAEREAHGEAAGRLEELEAQRRELLQRLERTIGRIDEALAGAGGKP